MDDIKKGAEKKIFTLCVIHQHPKVLLGFKKRGFGKGRWNGFGGKVNTGEEIEDAVKREVYEEAGVFVENLEKAGIIEFSFRGKPEVLEVHIFRAPNFAGSPMETEEMRPEWFLIDNMPFKEMWSADRYWYPLFFENKKFAGKVFFDESDNVLEKDFVVVERL